MPAHAERLRAMREVLDEHMIEVNDNGFIPEGLPIEGYLPSRDRAAYPLPRLMALGATAATRDLSNVPEFTALLADANPIVRHWAAQGLLMLGAGAAPARDRLVRDDALRSRRTEPRGRRRGARDPGAVARRRRRARGDRRRQSERWQVKLQALNALTFIGDQAKAVLPTIKRVLASDSQEYLTRAARYLVVVLEGRYEPSSPIFDPPARAPRPR